MTTTTGANAASAVPIYRPQDGNSINVAYGLVAVLIGAASGDIFQACKIPAGSIVVGGHFSQQGVDSNATPQATWDIGFGGDHSLAQLTQTVANKLTAQFADGIAALGAYPVAAADSIVTAKLTHAQGTAAAGTVAVEVYYVTG